ncbi:MAG: methyltransferase domain-containing protein [Alphaproteobacteria bacterium]|nr:methyltransferase domain-containing protein [Alphaproteobacteria bacterium]
MPFDTVTSVTNYDKNAFAQKRCTKELVKMLPNENIKSIIDIGAGTGLATIEVIKKFPNSEVVLLDKSPQMLESAKTKIPDAAIINADAEVFDFTSQNFDLAIANLSMQWFKDCRSFLHKVVKYTKYFAFSLPLSNSFNEYYSIFKNINLPLIRFYTIDEILAMLPSNTDIISTRNITETKKYPTAIEATRHFKNIGATMPVDATIQSKISAILKSYKSPIMLNYDLFLCVLKGT